MRSLGLRVETHRRKSGRTLYLRGRLVPELRAMLAASLPGVDLGQGDSINLTRDFNLTNQAAAKAWAAERHKELMAFRTGTARGMNLAQAVAWYETYLRGPREEPYAESTIAGLLVIARRVRDQLGPRRRVDSLREADLDQVAQAAQARSGTVESRRGSRSRARSFLSSLLDHGMTPLLSYEAIRRKLRAPRGGLSRRVKANWLQPAQVSAVLASVAGHQWEGFVRLVVLCGPRIQSARELRWERGAPDQGWVDLDGRLIHFYAAKTKSHHAWRLRWSPSVEDWLHSQPRREGLVFDGMTEHRSDYLMRETRRAAGGFAHPAGVVRRSVSVPWGDLCWKDLRANAATYLHCSHGIPGDTAEKALSMGHSPSTAAKKYVNEACVVDPAASTMEQAMGIEPMPSQEGGRLIRLA